MAVTPRKIRDSWHSTNLGYPQYKRCVPSELEGPTQNGASSNKANLNVGHIEEIRNSEFFSLEKDLGRTVAKNAEIVAKHLGLLQSLEPQILKVDKDSDLTAEVVTFVQNCSWMDARDHIRKHNNSITYPLQYSLRRVQTLKGILHLVKSKLWKLFHPSKKLIIVNVLMALKDVLYFLIVLQIFTKCITRSCVKNKHPLAQHLK